MKILGKYLRRIKNYNNINYNIISKYSHGITGIVVHDFDVVSDERVKNCKTTIDMRVTGSSEHIITIFGTTGCCTYQIWCVSGKVMKFERSYVIFSLYRLIIGLYFNWIGKTGMVVSRRRSGHVWKYVCRSAVRSLFTPCAEYHDDHRRWRNW